MLLRISLIVAILAGLGAGVVSYLDVSSKVPALIQQRNQENTAKKHALAELASTKSTLKKTQNNLAQTKQDLTQTKSERDKAIARANSEQKRADGLTTDLAKVKKERDHAQGALAAYKGTGLTAAQVLTLNKSLKNARSEIQAINDEKLVMLHTITRLTNELAQYVGPVHYVKLPAALHGKILAVDPKWDFVVLNIGENQGLIPNGELLVSREGKLVAKVIVRTVDKNRSIANLVPGWKLGNMYEGDEVTPAHPAT